MRPGQGPGTQEAFKDHRLCINQRTCVLVTGCMLVNFPAKFIPQVLSVHVGY